MRTARKIRYRLESLGLKSATKLLPLLSRKACYRLALLLGSLGAMLDRRGRRVALSNLRVAFGDVRTYDSEGAMEPMFASQVYSLKSRSYASCGPIQIHRNPSGTSIAIAL